MGKPPKHSIPTLDEQHKLDECIQMELIHFKLGKHKLPSRRELEALCHVLLEEQAAAIVSAQARGNQVALREAMLPVKHKGQSTAQCEKRWVPKRAASKLYDFNVMGKNQSLAMDGFQNEAGTMTELEARNLIENGLHLLADKITRDMRPLYGPRGRFTVNEMPKVDHQPDCMGVLLRPLAMDVEVGEDDGEGEGDDVYEDVGFDPTAASGSKPAPRFKKVYQCMSHTGLHMQKSVFQGHVDSYLWVHVGKGPNRWCYAHRIICWAFHGPPGPKQEVLHICGCPSCMNPQHLKWGLHQENCNKRKAKEVCVKRPE